MSAPLSGSSYPESDETRDKVAVNSPKAQKTHDWSHLMTQVSKDDENRPTRKVVTNNNRGQGKAQEEERERKDKEQALEEYMQVASSDGPKRPGSCNPCRICMGCFFKNQPPPGAPAGGAGHNPNNNLTQTADPAAGQGAYNQTSAYDNATNIQNAPNGQESPEASPDPSDDSEPDGLLGKIAPEHKGAKCLVLDLDETLVHSSFQPVECSFSVPIEIDGIRHEVYVLKRPFVDEFLRETAKHFELVVFTASLSEYANPVIDELDKEGVIKHRLFRESCVLHEVFYDDQTSRQAYVKDLSTLGRKLKDSIIVDNSPLSFLYDPTNAIGCTSWFGDPNDTELKDMVPVLNNVLKKTKDVRNILNANTQTCAWLINKYGGTDNPDEECE